MLFNISFALGVFFTLFILLTLSVIAGRRFGKKQIARHSSQLEVVTVAEGAVFTLLALLIAFAFSGAYDRFENRKIHIIDEANTISTAYQRISMLAPATQPAIRESFKEYVDSRLQLYKDAAHIKLIAQEMQDSTALEDKIWDESLAATKTTNDGAVTELYIAAVNDMFETQNKGLILTRVHPPFAIFGLLIGLAILSGFLAGYTTAENKSKVPLHIFCYISITAFTIYTIIDLEFPRVGLIRIDKFDKIIHIVRDRMNTPST
jgi:hypothetical protein